MSFFAARRSLKGGSSTTTTTTTTTTTAKQKVSSNAASSPAIKVTPSSDAPSSTTSAKMVTVMRKVSMQDKGTSLKERQKDNKAKQQREREKELQKEVEEEQQRRRRASLAKKRELEAEEADAKRRKLQAKGKAREIITHPASDSSEDSNDESGELGTPVNERRQPLRVTRNDIFAPKDNLQKVDIISGESLVLLNRDGYARYFDDMPAGKVVRVEYPGDNAYETFLLSKPKARDGEDYHPIQDIISTIRVICDYFLTPEQALEHFKYTQHASSSSLGGDFDFLRAPTPLATRDSTPISDVGTPELPLSSDAGTSYFTTPVHKEPLLRLLEKAYRRKNGPLFMSALDWYNRTITSLRESGSIRENIINMGRTTGIPEIVWTRLSGQCYERTVGPRVEELKKYAAFSDNTYGELLPPFVAHIASLTGLKEGSVLVDMGSGVGNCVVQASLATGCKSYGFENQPQAASIASSQVSELSARCRLWGLSPGPCSVHECDFLSSPSLIGPAMSSADVVLVNNYVFSPTTNESLSLMFLDLKDGAKIVSLKPFVNTANGGMEITSRNVYSPASILKQGKSITYARNSVSWSGEGGKFYVATVSRDNVRKFLERNGGV